MSLALSGAGSQMEKLHDLDRRGGPAKSTMTNRPTHPQSTPDRQSDIAGEH